VIPASCSRIAENNLNFGVFLRFAPILIIATFCALVLIVSGTVAVSATNAQAESDCQVTITDGDVVALKEALEDENETAEIICVSGDFLIESTLYPMARPGMDSLTIKTESEASFTNNVVTDDVGQTMLDLGEGGPANLTLEGISFYGSEDAGRAVWSENLII